MSENFKKIKNKISKTLIAEKKKKLKEELDELQNNSNIDIDIKLQDFIISRR